MAGSGRQLACLELRGAASRELSPPELLELIGSAPSGRRDTLYRRCRPALSPAVRTFWDGRSAQVASGIGAAGKAEDYFALFLNRVLPLVHSGRIIELLLGGGTHPRPDTLS